LILLFLEALKLSNDYIGTACGRWTDSRKVRQINRERITI